MDEQPTMAEVLRRLREIFREDPDAPPDPKPLPEEIERTIRE
jgi:hypothetical protein